MGYGVADIEAALAAIGATGVRLLDARPRHGSMGASIAFLHPSDVGGVLTELVQSASRVTAGLGHGPQAPGRRKSAQAWPDSARKGGASRIIRELGHEQQRTGLQRRGGGVRCRHRESELACGLWPGQSCGCGRAWQAIQTNRTGAGIASPGRLSDATTTPSTQD